MLEIETRNREGVTILGLSGRLAGGQSVSALNLRIRELLNKGQLQVVLNLSGVPFIDSSGVGELVTAFTTMKKQGGFVKLAAVAPMVNEVLRITRLLTVIESFPDEDAAVASFQKDPSED